MDFDKAGKLEKIIDTNIIYKDIETDSNLLFSFLLLIGKKLLRK
jgi:hypothetical protein